LYYLRQERYNKNVIPIVVPINVFTHALPNMNETRSILLKLVIDGLAKSYPEMLPAGILKPDGIRSSTACNKLKLDLLRATYEKHGPQAVLKIGLCMKSASISPVSNILIEASEPSYLLKKWISLEKKLALRFRIRYRETKKNKSIEIHHFSSYGDPSTNVEDLFICGIQIALFELMGCQNIRCSFVTENQDVLVYDCGELVTQQTLSTDHCFSRWNIEWSSIIGKVKQIDQPISNLGLFSDYNDPMKIIYPVLSIFSEDITKIWKIEEVASRLSLSTRTLQRYLSAAGLSFSLLTRATRINKAGQLLLEQDASITEISHQCGFSDSAHFSRDFRASVGLTPSEYRAHC